MPKTLKTVEESMDALKNENESSIFLNEAHRHCKTIAASGAEVQLLRTVGIIRVAADTQASRSSAEQGIVTNPDDGAAKISFGVH